MLETTMVPVPETQTITGQEFKKNGNVPGFSSGKGRRPLILDLVNEKVFSEWEVMFLCTIVNSTKIINGRECRIYWCTRTELIDRFGEDIYKQLEIRGAIDEWTYIDGFQATTLTPWCASVLGVRIAEYWVRHIELGKEYRGLHKKPARVRIQKWDTESYWTYRDRPERSVRIPGNTCELPLIGDPEDRSHQGQKEEYLEDWETWSFTKSPKKAIAITIRVGSFAHKITIQRGSRNQKSKKKKHGHKRNHKATGN